MTPREALYHLSMALGPIPETTRNDNLSPQESMTRDAVNTLQKWVDAQVLPRGDLFMHIAEPQQWDSAATRYPLREQMVASGVKIWDWDLSESEDVESSIEPSEVSGKDGLEPWFSTETAEKTDGTAVSHGAETGEWDDKTTLLGDASYTEELIEDITEWHYDRNLIDGSTDKDQFCKLIQECGELSDNLCKGADIRDDIGDIMVVLINIAERNSLTISECLNMAYEDIKDRKGQMVDGVFVKED